MPAIAYTVTATLPDEHTLRRYIDWLQSGHTADVLAAGAATASIIHLDADPGEPPHRVQTSYTFPDRAAFNVYVQNKAPALRAEGLALFAPESGVTFSRSIGTILD